MSLTDLRNCLSRREPRRSGIENATLLALLLLTVALGFCSCAQSSDSTVDDLAATLMSPDAGGDAKRDALLKLGEDGSRRAIAAIREFEEWTKQRPKRIRIAGGGARDHPSPHFGETVDEPIASIETASGESRALVELNLFGRRELFLVRPGEWMEMNEVIPLDLPTWRNPGAFHRMRSSGAVALMEAEEDGVYIVRLGQQDFRVNPAELALDSDGDGLADSVESRIQTNPRDADSDGDGKPDGQDGNPLTPSRPSAGEKDEIRQAVFSYFFATTDATAAIILNTASASKPQEFEGYLGMVIASPGHVPGFTSFGIGVKSIGRSGAVASFSDYVGPLAASGHTVKLQKRRGKWVVIEAVMNSIS